MTTPIPGNEDALSDPRVDAAWRAASHEDPPAALDAAILAAARREVGAGPQRADVKPTLADRRRWWPLAAAATIAAVAVGVLQLTPPDQLGSPAPEKAVIMDMPAPDKKLAPEAVKAAPREEVAKDAPTPGNPIPTRSMSARKESTTDNATVDRVAPRADAPSVPPPAATTPAPAKPEVVARTAAALPEPFPAASAVPNAASGANASAAAVPEYSGRVAAPNEVPQVATAVGGAPAGRLMSKDNAGAPSKALAKSSQPAAPAAAAPSSEAAKVGAAQMRTERARASDSAQLPVPEWIALIRRLRGEGKVVEAAKELAAFRAAHVDHEKLLPRDLTDWRPLP